MQMLLYKLIFYKYITKLFNLYYNFKIKLFYSIYLYIYMNIYLHKKIYFWILHDITVSAIWRNVGDVTAESKGTGLLAV